MERLLRVETNYFVAGAVFVKTGSEWRCVRSAPILKWMVGKPNVWIKANLKRLKYRYEWR